MAAAFLSGSTREELREVEKPTVARGSRGVSPETQYV